MSMSERISLQPVSSKEAGDGNLDGDTESVVQDDTNDGQEVVASTQVLPTLVTVSRWKKVFITVMTVFTFTLLYAAISMIAPFYPIEAQKHNVTTYITGFVVAMAPLCLALTSPLIGYFLPYLGAKFTQLAGLLWAGGSLILFGFLSIMPSPTLFVVFSFLLRTVEGIGTAMYTTVSYTLLTQLYPDKKGTIVGFVHFGIAGGFCLGPAIGGGLQEAGGFMLPFIIAGGCILVSFLLLMVLVVPPVAYSSVKQPWRLVLKLFCNPAFSLILVSLMLADGAGAAILTYFAKFAHMQFKLSVGIIGAIYFGPCLTYGLGTIFAGPLTDKLKRPRFMIVCGLVVTSIGCAFIGPAKFITTPKLWLSIPAMVIVGGGLPFVIVPTFSDMSGIAKTLHTTEADLASTLSGFFIGGISAGDSLGPIIGGFLDYSVGFQSMAAIFSLALLICALVLVIVTVVQQVWKSCFNKSTKEGHNESSTKHI